MNGVVNVDITEPCVEQTLETQINDQQQIIKNRLIKHRLRLAVAVIFLGLLINEAGSISGDLKNMLSGLITVSILWVGFEFIKQLRAKNIIDEFKQTSALVEHCLISSDLLEVTLLESKLSLMVNVMSTKQDKLLCLYAQSVIFSVSQHVNNLKVNQYKQTLQQQYKQGSFRLIREYSKRLDKHPLMQVKNKLDIVFNKLTARRADLQSRWDITYDTLSWWNKLKYAEGPNFSELDADIATLQSMKTKFDMKHQDDLDKLNKDYLAKKVTALKRLETDYKSASNFVIQHYSLTGSTPAVIESELLKVAGWAGAFGLAYSLWDDFMTTHQVYDALRNVNGNFEGMSDAEVWLETLWMSEDSLAGLASLTKGAYFEELVAADTQGELFEHFNHPDTDITIDGVAYQLKATDSASYVNSVEDGILVMSTSEVAETTSAIDSGFTNAELSADVDMALDGIGVDIGDAMTDGLLSGLGGLGFFATLNGINHASDRYNKGCAGEEAIFEGIAVAIEGTAKAMVDTGEMVYNIAMSRPSRAVGRGIVKVFKKIDEKIEEAEKAEKEKNNR